MHQVEPARTRLRDDVREGLRYMRHHTALRRIALVLAVLNFFYFAAISLLVLYTSDQLHAGKIVYTALFVAAALGTVTSRWFVGRLHSRFGSTRTMTISFWKWASTVIVLAVTGIPAVAIGAFVLLGFGNGLWLVLNTTIRQQVTPQPPARPNERRLPNHLLGRRPLRLRLRRRTRQSLRPPSPLHRRRSHPAPDRSLRQENPRPRHRRHDWVARRTRRLGPRSRRRLSRSVLAVGARSVSPGEWRREIGPIAGRGRESWVPLC